MRNVFIKLNRELKIKICLPKYDQVYWSKLNISFTYGEIIITYLLINITEIVQCFYIWLLQKDKLLIDITEIKFYINI